MNRPILLAASALLACAAACSKAEPAADDPAAELKYGQPESEADAGAGTKPGTGAGAGAKPASGAAAPAASANPAAPDAEEEAILKVVPTVEEAAAKAAREIDAANAEQMLAEIRKEVGGGQ